MTRGEIEAELRWYFQQSEGELGQSSNFGSFVARLEGGDASTRPTEVDERRLRSAQRSRRIQAVLFELGPSVHVVLIRAFSAHGSVLRVAKGTDEAAHAWAASRTKRNLWDWLERLEKAARKGDSERRRTFARIQLAATRALDSALEEFATEERRQRAAERSRRVFGEGACRLV